MAKPVVHGRRESCAQKRPAAMRSTSVPAEKLRTKLKSADLHRELVPLSEATAVAYHIITENPESLRDPRDLNEVRGLVAIALSTVVTILKRENGEALPLSSTQIDEQLFFPTSHSPRDRRAAPDLSRLFVRRGDLVRAIETLKEVHVSFGRQDVLAALKRR
jgi:hypothetical protein